MPKHPIIPPRPAEPPEPDRRVLCEIPNPEHTEWARTKSRKKAPAETIEITFDYNDVTPAVMIAFVKAAQVHEIVALDDLFLSLLGKAQHDQMLAALWSPEHLRAVGGHLVDLIWP